MPAVTTTAIMILTNVGLQLFNSWRSTQTSEELRKKQQEFQEAAQNRNSDKMMQLLREGNALQQEIEEEAHKQRMKNLNEDFDKLIERTFQQYDIQQWPLRVLPMVMKNQSLGSFRTQSDENLVLHVILTQSNNKQFNDIVFPQIELAVEAFCNQYLNTLSSHPILFYSGAWKSKIAPEDYEILQLQEDLPNLPVLMITPYFRLEDKDSLVFNINMWGIGEPQQIEIQPSPKEFIYYNLYAQDTNFGEELAAATINEFVPYLECMIGYLVDVYFWTSHRILPILPTLFAKGIIENNKVTKDFLLEGYSNIYTSDISLLDKIPTNSNSQSLIHIANYLVATTNIMDSNLFQKQLEQLYLKVCEVRGGLKTDNISIAITDASKNNIFLPCDSDFLTKFSELHKVKSIERKHKIHHNMKTINANQYSYKRDELLGLIEQVLKVDGIKDTERNTFLATQRRLQENQFNIVLIGEFQGGKSTTFNALCGGREISPRGAMNKTSAICITATNLADKNAEEYAEVRWKSNSDKMKLMESFIGLLTPEDLGVTLGEGEVFNVEKYFSFDNIAHIEALQNAIEIQETAYKYEQEYYEVLRMAKLILAFSSNSDLKRLLCENKFEITDVARFAIFPEKWEERWTNIHCFEDIKKQFSVNDIIFAFVGEISCHIHSKNLAKLGCSVTDCPGLFASSWDTSVAIDAISKANAVIYLLGGNKQMGEGDEKAISTIFQQKSLTDKVFFAINKKQNDTITNNIVNTDKSKITNLGLGLNDVSIWEFNALLFFLSEFGQAFLNNTLDEFSQERFLEVAEKNGYQIDNIENILKQIIQNIAAFTFDNKLLNIQHLDSNAIKTIKESSSSDLLLTTINNSIVTQKAESILINNGAEKVNETLAKIDARLKSTEEEAIKTVQQAEAEFQSAQETYQVFENKVKEILSTAFPEYLSQQLAQNAYIEITQPKVIDNIALKLAIDIPKLLTIKQKTNAAWYKLMEKVANGKILNEEAAEQRDKAKKELEDLLGPVVKNVVQVELTNAIETWQNLLNNGKHHDYKAYILPKLDEIVDKINAEWDKAILKSDLLKGYSIPKISLDNSLQAFNTSDIANSQGVVNATAEAAIRILVQEVITEVVAILSGIIVGLIVDLLLFGGMGHIFGAIYAVITYFGTKLGIVGRNKDKIPTKRDDLSKDQKKIYDNMRPSLGDTFQNSDTRTRAVDGLKKCPQNIFYSFANYYKKLLNEQKLSLEKDIEEKRALRQKSLDKQDEIANQAKTIRETQIIPLEKKVINFIDSCY